MLSEGILNIYKLKALKLPNLGSKFWKKRLGTVTLYIKFNG